MLQQRPAEETDREDRHEEPQGGFLSVLGRGARLLLQVLLPLALLAGAYAGYQYLLATKPAVTPEPPQEAVSPVRAVTVTHSSYQPQLTLYGETVAGREVQLRALVSGEVVEASPNLREGGEVSDGDLLLKIDPFDYEIALAEARAQIAETEARLQESEAQIRAQEAALERAREQLEIAERDLARAERLVDTGAVSRQTLDQRRLTVSQRQDAVEQGEISLSVQQARADQQRAALERLRATRRTAERNLRDTSLTAPFNAYVSEPNAEVGKVLGTNDAVATLIDKSWIEVRVTLSDAQYGRLVRTSGGVLGRPVEVRWYVGEEPFVYEAEIVRVGSQIASASGGVNVFARIKTPLEPTPLRPGAFVEVRVPDIQYEDVVRLPQTALYNNDHVYVIEDGRLTRRSVEQVGGADGYVLVRGDLQDGERVAATRLARPGEGVKVTVVEADV
ncbi:efflux RND transporter periplasmic adaptor subunit [Dichotomicrobium thermohalophilum]|uniref:RND family efflux transporter MFP subunit n=1 Tax=Dichotomicrobium thermohalophilum TaxID=933063 RepID=A0A397PP61_9HYPH|nr:efflux RND transporter periplasmic adaptor subunit [Dichotomicrobium thermohalophilum]RIA47521.1 RND family efflux transporter MFP subunit [Dichotomicrobium thermohalophilum]